MFHYEWMTFGKGTVRTMSEPKKTKQPKVAKIRNPLEPPQEGDADNVLPPSIGEIAKANAAKKRSISTKDVFVFVKASEAPLAPQANQIVNTIQAAGASGRLRADLVEDLKAILTTRQPAERVLTYYQKSLIDAGLVRIENPDRVAA